MFNWWFPISFLLMFPNPWTGCPNLLLNLSDLILWIDIRIIWMGLWIQSIINILIIVWWWQCLTIIEHGSNLILFVYYSMSNLLSMQVIQTIQYNLPKYLIDMVLSPQHSWYISIPPQCIVWYNIQKFKLILLCC